MKIEALPERHGAGESPAPTRSTSYFNFVTVTSS